MARSFLDNILQNGSSRSKWGLDGCPKARVNSSPDNPSDMRRKQCGVSVPSSHLLPTSRCSILSLGNSFQGRKQMFTLLLRAGKLFVQIEWSTKAWDDSLPLLWMEPCLCTFLHLETSMTATGWSIARIPTYLVMVEAHSSALPPASLSHCSQAG